MINKDIEMIKMKYETPLTHRLVVEMEAHICAGSKEYINTNGNNINIENQESEGDFVVEGWD